MLELAAALLHGLAPIGASLTAGNLSPSLRLLPYSARIAAGAVFVSALAFFLTACGLGRALWVPFVVAAIAAAWKLRPAKPVLALLWLLPFAAMYALVALAPDTGPDAIAYHLSIPARWLETGQFFEPAGHYESMPHGFELFFAAAGMKANLVHFTFFLASVPLMLATARKLGFDGWPAACLYFFIPVAGVTATSAYVDAALAFFALAAFYFLLEDRPGWAGALAGFCYAVKMTGIVAPPAVVLYLVARRRWREAGVAGAAAAAVMLPWIARAWWMTGNPFAPLLNDWFPNPFFHAGTEESLKQYVGSYGVPWREMAWELTLGGVRTNGLLGPVLLLAPLGLLALRRPSGRALWIAAIVAALPWWLNHGTRFLLPAAVFVCLAMTLAVPRPIAWILAAAQGIACWPAAMDRWADPAAWRIEEIPVRAALHIENHGDYLKRVSPEYRVANFLSRNTKPDDKILDLVGVSGALSDRQVFSHWQYANAERAADALRVAAFADAGTFRQLQSLWPPRKLAAIRVELTSGGRQSWALQEIEMMRGGQAIYPSRLWELAADPNPWETPLLFDRNPASRWQSWSKAEAGMYVEVSFPDPVECDGIRITGWRDDSTAVRISGREVVGGWVRLGSSPDRRASPALSLRRRASQYARREGFDWIVVHSAEGLGRDAAWGRLGRMLVHHPGDWGVRLLGLEDGVALLGLLGGGR